MIRTLQFIYQWLTRSAVIGCVSLLTLLATLALCLANLGLIKYAVIGILVGIIFWKWPVWVRYLLGIAALIILLVACGLSAVPEPQFNWEAVYKAEISINSSGIWMINEQVTIPAGALRQITEGNGRFAINLPPPRADQYQIDIERLTQMIEPYGLKFIGVENGTDPIFSFPERSLTHLIPMVPMVTTQMVNLPYLRFPVNRRVVIPFAGPSSLPGPRSRPRWLNIPVNILPGNGSSVIITGPSAIIEATTPASESEATTTGEERVISAESFSSSGIDSGSVSISTLSILARHEPLRTMAGLSLSSGISWVVAGIWTLLIVAVRTGFRAAAKSGWQHIYHAKASPGKAKTDQNDMRGKGARPKKGSYAQVGSKISHGKGARPKRALRKRRD